MPPLASAQGARSQKTPFSFFCASAPALVGAPWSGRVIVAESLVAQFSW